MPKILIADDSIAVRKVAERLLTEAGMGVTLAANGSEALALLSKDRPDLIVSDVIMPDKSGYEVCAFIRAQANLADIPVLLISGIVNDEVSRQAESCKADGVLKKPFQGTSLKDRVLELLMKRQPKPAPIPPSPTAGPGESSVVSELPVAPIACSPEEPEPTLLKTHESQRLIDSATISRPESNSMPITESSHETAAPMVDPLPVESTVSTEADGHYGKVLAERDARITALEEQLACERRQGHEQIQQMQNALEQQRVQVADLSSRTGALDQALAEERAQRITLTEQLDEVSRQAHRVDELEAGVAEARRRAEELLQQVSDNARNVSRILELEAHLVAERAAATQLVQQLTTLEQIERWAHELETTLASEREQTKACRKQGAVFETLAARVPVLEEALEQERARVAELAATVATERETAALVMTQVKQLEPVVQRIHDLDLALAEERERSMQLMKRATEAEQVAEQSNRRFEDLARKLGEIAGLASQLGNGKR